MTSHIRTLPWRIAGLYALFGLAWILLTDQGLRWLSLDANIELVMQTWKGTAFVLASAVLIYLLLRRAARIIRRQTAALEQSEARHRLLFDRNPHPIWAYDLESLHFITANQAAVDCLGYSAIALRAISVHDLLVAEDLPRFNALHERLCRDESASNGRWRVRRKDGTMVYLDIVSDAIVLDGRRARICQGKDVTAQVAAEASLIDLSRQLASVNAEVHDIGQAAAHQLQQPLRQVVSHLQLLAKHCAGLDGAAQDFLTFAIDGALRMKTTLDDVVQLTGMDPEPPAPTNLGRVIDEVVMSLQPRLVVTGGQVHVGALPVLLVRERHLRLVFLHLLDNAIKFRHPDRPPDIHVTAEQVGSVWSIRVSDNGIGIAPEYHLDVFGAFRRLHGDHTMPGNGIGLAVCKKIIEQHGGTVGMESRLDGGSTVILTLPQG